MLFALDSGYQPPQAPVEQSRLLLQNEDAPFACTHHANTVLEVCSDAATGDESAKPGVRFVIGSFNMFAVCCSSVVDISTFRLEQ